MTKTNDYKLRNEKLSLMIGTMVGQISELLNNIKYGTINIDQIYESLFDINNAGGLFLHAIYFKEKNQDNKEN